MSRRDRVRTESFRGTAQAEQFGEKVRETRLRWFGCAEEGEWINQKKDDEDGAERQEKRKKHMLGTG